MTKREEQFEIWEAMRQDARRRQQDDRGLNLFWRRKKSMWVVETWGRKNGKLLWSNIHVFLRLPPFPRPNSGLYSGFTSSYTMDSFCHN